MKAKSLLAVGIIALLTPLALIHAVLRASLPQLDGDVHRLGLIAAVHIDRDGRGIASIEADNRPDLAFGTGFAHGQDRFFQMDLSRRLAAGELAELVGVAAVAQDERARLFRFRRVAREALGQASAAERAVLEAYARGVNAGVNSLRSRPWEYWILGSAPARWQPEDTLLVSFAMWWDLQYSAFQRQILRETLNARLGGPQCAGGWKCALQFFYPSRTSWDAPNVSTMGTSTSQPLIPIPAADVLDVRDARIGARGAGRSGTSAVDANADLGSNNWAVAGRLTASGAALVANDMHLNVRVPAVWYRARLRIRASVSAPALELNGLTLPGAPLVVAGSNGHIAWGMTNSYGDWLDVRLVRCTRVGTGTVQSPTGTFPLTIDREEIRIHGQPSRWLSVQSGPDGVLLVAHPAEHICWFGSWLAQQAAATNMGLMGLERATSVSQALDIAATTGIPHQNFVVGDREGHIGWTIAGRIPGQSQNRADGQTWLAPPAYPRIIDPPVGRIWSANSRATDDPSAEAEIGGADASVGADYALGARAQQIRDDLLSLRGGATPADMLRVQLDDRAIFLTRWRALLCDLLDERSTAAHPLRAQFRRLVADSQSRASVDSVGYRLVRTFHDRTQAAVWQMLLGALGIDADAEVPGQFEAALWQLVNERPLHLLAAQYPSWRQFLLVQLDATLAQLQQSCTSLERCTWGSRNVVRIRHPLSGSLPWLSRFLDMPTLELPGDHDMPRVQDGSMGASERFAVSPGHEDQGYLELPGGQSGHPLSPYYRDEFMDWAQGVRAPFLPGPSQHRLTLQPD